MVGHTANLCFLYPSVHHRHFRLSPSQALSVDFALILSRYKKPRRELPSLASVCLAQGQETSVRTR